MWLIIYVKNFIFIIFLIFIVMKVIEVLFIVRWIFVLFVKLFFSWIINDRLSGLFSFCLMYSFLDIGPGSWLEIEVFIDILWRILMPGRLRFMGCRKGIWLFSSFFIINRYLELFNQDYQVFIYFKSTYLNKQVWKHLFSSLKNKMKLYFIINF